MTKTMSGQKIVNIAPAGLAASVQAAAPKGPPPVHLWHPPFCGDIDMRIARDGTWFYLGTPIGRPALVKLFSQILRREGDLYFLVTPVEKVGIIVDDAPLFAIDFDAAGTGQDQSLRFTTLTDDTVTASAENPIRAVIDPQTGEPAPYVHVRAGLEALIDRKSFYRMIDLGTHAPHKGASWFGIWSSGTFFPIVLSSELP
jgi:hypothetical protein